MVGNQAPTAVMMVRPDHFGYNQETAASNSFQNARGSEKPEIIKAKAIMEFDGLVEVLKASGVAVIEFRSDSGPDVPDAVFPNNWVSFHPDGVVIVYPMMAPSRRLERRMDFIDILEKQYLFEVNKVHDISHSELRGEYLEGTGSLVLDYVNQIVYVNHSPRTNTKLVKKVANILGYSSIQFKALDADGKDIYHTNVLMCVAGSYAVVCMEAVTNPKDQVRLAGSFSKTGHEIIEISRHQMNQFAGNMMELRNIQGDSVLAMSQSAYDSLNLLQIQTIEKYSSIVYAPIDTIEKYAGGSVRCMMAGVFLPRKP